MSKITGFSDLEQRLYNKLRPNGDVAIPTIFRTIFARWPEPSITPRQQQQRISASLWRLNRKLAPHKLRVVPGVKRRSYRLSKIDG